MACAGDNIDHSANLPDELIHLVFSYLRLHDKLSVESVSRRFKRCVLELMKMQPQPLELLDNGFLHINEYIIQPVQRGQLFNALRSLAKKSKFTEVKIRTPWIQDAEEKRYMNTLILILLESNCLDKVVSFECNSAPSQSILEKIIAKCVRLSTIRFDFVVHPPNTQLWTPDSSEYPDFSIALDLNPVVNTKALTQWELRLTAYPQERLIELFHSIKPQTLEKLSLSFYHEMPTLDLAVIVKQLHTNAWAALQELNFCWRTSAVVHLAPFFQSLSLLPALEKCDIRLHDEDIQPDNQFVAASTALFNCDIKITLSSDGFLRRGNMSDCQVMAQILQLQKISPSVGVDFYFNDDYDALFLTLSNGTGSFVEEPNPRSCGDVHCVDCHRFYPSVLSALQDIANGCDDNHLDHYQLDKCRIDIVVEHLYCEVIQVHWEALTAEKNEAGDLVTISFDALAHNATTVLHQYAITVACGPCFSSSCIRCVNVE